MVTDRSFLADNVRAMAMQARVASNVFVYSTIEVLAAALIQLLKHVTTTVSRQLLLFFNIIIRSSSIHKTIINNITGPSHVDDIYYYFNMPGYESMEKNVTDREMIEQMTTMVERFSRSGYHYFFQFSYANFLFYFNELPATNYFLGFPVLVIRSSGFL
jgi:hypothetical protein